MKEELAEAKRMEEDAHIRERFGLIMLFFWKINNIEWKFDSRG